MKKKLHPDSLGAILQMGYEWLRSIPNYSLEAEVLLAHVLQASRTYLYTHADTILTFSAIEKYSDLCQQRSSGRPLAYLLGHKEFWSLELEVNSHTLIPRPETELLVEVVLTHLNSNAALSIIDLGVGSGTIAIAIAKERPFWNLIGIDCSTEALHVAKRNVEKYNLHNITLVQSDWFKALTAMKADAIISNPPYIAADDPHLSELRYEPSLALIAGQEGLEAISLIIAQADAYLKKGGLLAFEHGYNQAEQVHKLLKDKGYTAIETYLDISGNERVTIGVW